MLRDRLKPGWRTLCDPIPGTQTPSEGQLRDRIRKAAKSVAEAGTLVRLASGAPLGGRILEVGCYDGAVAHELARIHGAQPVASDLARYYVTQRPAEPTEAQVQAQQTRLAELRERARIIAGIDTGRVEFIEDDITTSSLDPGSFDAIVSFEVLEHVQRPAEAFAAMARLLRPGGILYHDYNPFFSSIGGHSLCTLDFPWGHVRLDAGDFERYLREIRPTEVDQGLRFYTESLNRMTLAEMRAGIVSAGLELLAVVPWYERALVQGVTPDVLAEVQRTYPEATTEDLLATFVAVVARRPVAHQGTP
jgi:SAM-dependent methyltransferase